MLLFSNSFTFRQFTLHMIIMIDKTHINYGQSLLKLLDLKISLMQFSFQRINIHLLLWINAKHSLLLF